MSHAILHSLSFRGLTYSEHTIFCLFTSLAKADIQASVCILVSWLMLLLTTFDWIARLWSRIQPGWTHCWFTLQIPSNKSKLTHSLFTNLIFHSENQNLNIFKTFNPSIQKCKIHQYHRLSTPQNLRRTTTVQWNSSKELQMLCSSFCNTVWKKR